MTSSKTFYILVMEFMRRRKVHVQSSRSRPSATERCSSEVMKKHEPSLVTPVQSAKCTKYNNSTALTSMDHDHQAVGEVQSGAPYEKKVDLKTETERLYYSSRCKGCLKNPASHVVLPCSELSICTNCVNKNVTECPSCHGPIETTIQTFM